MVLAICPVAMSFLTAAAIVVDGTLRPFAEVATVVDRLAFTSESGAGQTV